jgi:hypothetical protein
MDIVVLAVVIFCKFLMTTELEFSIFQSFCKGLITNRSILELQVLHVVPLEAGTHFGRI